MIGRWGRPGYRAKTSLDPTTRAAMRATIIPATHAATHAATRAATHPAPP